MGQDRTVFMTGFPGFVAGRLLRGMLESDPALQVVCLVEPRFEFRAREEARMLSTNGGQGRGRVTVAVGDITDPLLALDAETRADLAERVTDVFHLAAVCDLAAPRRLARLVNVRGTRHVLEFARGARGLRRMVHFSTCHVSGTRTGTVYEDELDVGQGFKNHHESTKHDAEYLVRQASRAISTLVIRPSVVVGDRDTGQAPRFDGPSYLMILVDRLGRLRLPLPYVGRLAAEANFVPVDYVVDGTVALWSKGAEGTFALADPHPMTGREMYDEIVRGVGAMGPLGRVHPSLLDLPLRIGRVRRMLDVPREALAYLNHPVHYDCARALDALEGTDVRCTDARDVLPVLIRFYLENRDRPELRRVPG